MFGSTELVSVTAEPREPFESVQAQTLYVCVVAVIIQSQVSFENHLELLSINYLSRKRINL